MLDDLAPLTLTEAARQLVADLREQAIIVRQTRGYGLAHCVRMTLGTAEQMEMVVGALQMYKIRN